MCFTSVKTSPLSADNNTSSQNAGWPVLVLYWWPGWVLLLIFPTLVFSKNQAGFYYEVSILNPFLLAAGAWMLATTLVWFILPRAWRPPLATAGLWLGVWLLLKDYVAPVRVSNLIGYSGQESAEVSGAAIAAEVILVIALSVVAWRLRRRNLLGPGAIFAFGLTLAQAGIFVSQLEPSSRSGLEALLGIAPGKWLSGRQPDKPATTGNIYHIVVDGYAAHSFPDAMKLGSLDDNAWPGFTYYRRNWSNYDVTHPSVASFLTGSLFPGGDLRAWRERQATQGVFAQMIAHGYPVWLYPANDHYDKHPFSYRRIFQSRSTLRRKLQLADLMALRMAPTFLKDRVFSSGRGIATHAFVKLQPQTDKWISTWITLGSPAELADYFRALVSDEQERPANGQYVYMHLYLPHGPFELDRQAKPRVAPLYSPTNPNAAYLEQAAGVNTLLQSFLQELKRLGRYEKSTILIHADHGLSSYPSPKPLPWKPEDNAAIMKVSLGIGHVLSIEPAVASLLLFKPAGAAPAPLQFSDRPTQLLDIPATLYASLDWQVATPAGRSFVAPDYPADQERSVYFGYMQRKGDQIIWFGKDIRVGEINHFSWSAAAGWKVYPNLQATLN